MLWVLSVEIRGCHLLISGPSSFCICGDGAVNPCSNSNALQPIPSNQQPSQAHRSQGSWILVAGQHGQVGHWMVLDTEMQTGSVALGILHLTLYIFLGFLEHVFRLLAVQHNQHLGKVLGLGHLTSLEYLVR